MSKKLIKKILKKRCGLEDDSLAKIKKVIGEGIKIEELNFDVSK